MSLASDRKIGLFGATMLVAGNMIGSGVFLMPAAMAQTGSVTVLGWIFVVPGALLLSMIFARLGKTQPLDGGPYAWARDSFGRFTGFQSNALYWLGNLIGNIAIAVSVTGYLSEFLLWSHGPMAAAVTTIAIIWLVTVGNIIGPKFVAMIESGTTMFGLLPILAVGTLGWIWFDPALFTASWHPAGGSTLDAAIGAVALMFWSFTGMESAAVAAAVVRDPAKNVPRATLLGVAISAVVYVLSTSVVLGIVPVERLAASEAPFAEVVGAVLGPVAAIVMAGCALVKATGALGGWTLLVAEAARVAAKDGVFPSLFAKVDGRGIPVRGLCTTACLSTAIVLLTLAPTLGGLFGRLVSMSTLLVLPAYIFAAVAMARAESGWLRFVGVMGAVFGVWVASTPSANDALITLLFVLLAAPLFVFFPPVRKEEVGTLRA